MGELVQGYGNGIHSSPFLWLNLGTCTQLALPTPGVDICGAAGPDKPAGQHAPGGTYTWVSQAVHAVEDQATHAGWHQRPQHSQGGVTPNLVPADEHVLGSQLGT